METKNDMKRTAHKAENRFQEGVEYVGDKIQEGAQKMKESANTS